MRRNRFRAVVVALASIAAGCGSFGGSDGTLAQEDAGSLDASTTDGSRGDSGSAMDAGSSVIPIVDAGPTNLLTNGDFELGCANWGAAGGTIAPSDVPHNGAHSCMVCADNSGSSFFPQRFDAKFPPGAQLTGWMWVRAVPTGSVTSVRALVSGFAFQVDTAVIRADSQPIVASAWFQAPFILKVPPDIDGGTTSVEIRIWGMDKGGCALIDDAVLYRSN
jgi:hypothetical protein